MGLSFIFFIFFLSLARILHYNAPRCTKTGTDECFFLGCIELHHPTRPLSIYLSYTYLAQ